MSSLRGGEHEGSHNQEGGMRSRMRAPGGGAPSGGVWRLMACHKRASSSHKVEKWRQRMQIICTSYKSIPRYQICSRNFMQMKDKYFYLIVLLWVMITFAASNARMKHLPRIH